MDPKGFQLYLEVVIDVLEKQDITAISQLKDFLCSIPSPKHIEQLLATAVLHFAKNNQPIFAWIMANQDALAPELDLLTFTKRLTTSRLGERGWIPGRDFQFEGNETLLIQAGSRVNLMDCFHQGELLLIRTAFDINS